MLSMMTSNVEDRSLSASTLGSAPHLAHRCLSLQANRHELQHASPLTSSRPLPVPPLVSLYWHTTEDAWLSTQIGRLCSSSAKCVIMDQRRRVGAKDSLPGTNSGIERTHCRNPHCRQLFHVQLLPSYPQNVIDCESGSTETERASSQIRVNARSTIVL